VRESVPKLFFRPLQLFERIEHFKSGTPEVSVIATGDRQPMPARGRCNITVFDRHPMSRLVEESLLVSPHMRNSYIEAVDSSLERVHKPREPRLKSLTLPSVLCAHPIRQLGNDDCAGVTAVLFMLEPSDHPRVVCVEQSAHNLRRRGRAARRYIVRVDGTSFEHGKPIFFVRKASKHERVFLDVEAGFETVPR
jgi:hypothetical protein